MSNEIPAIRKREFEWQKSIADRAQIASTVELKVIYVGGRIATAEARLTDSAGKLYAHGSTTCLIIPMTERT